jgi:hypothetical protein
MHGVRRGCAGAREARHSHLSIALPAETRGNLPHGDGLLVGGQLLRFLCWPDDQTIVHVERTEMSEKENECWKLLNRELREAKAAATTREAYPQRTRFDQQTYDRLAADAWRRCRERMEQLRRAEAMAETVEMARVALAGANTVPNAVSLPSAVVGMPAATADSGPTPSP